MRKYKTRSLFIVPFLFFSCFLSAESKTKIIFGDKGVTAESLGWKTKTYRYTSDGVAVGAAVLNGCYATQGILNLFNKNRSHSEKAISLVVPLGFSIAGHYLARDRDMYHKVTAGAAVGYAALNVAVYILRSLM